MKRVITALLAVALLFSACFIMPAYAEDADATATGQHFNVVFCVDASNSMNRTDKNKWRFDAINEFLSLLTTKGNYVGSVVYNDTILQATPVKEVNGKTDKNSIYSSIANTKAVSFTNIGQALAKANELLKNGNPDLPSVIILLSDGKTELNVANMSKDKAKTLNANAATTENNAIAAAKDAGTPVYCIGLDGDKDAPLDPAELKKIATQTGGELKIVKSAADLNDVYKTFYTLIFGTEVHVTPVKLPYEGTFNVPLIGVDEVNILIEGEITKISLIKPDGSSVSDTELKDMKTAGKAFTNIKIPEPIGGKWTLKLDGKKGGEVKINYIPNLNVSVNTTSPISDSYKRGETVNIEAKIASHDAEVNDDAVYQAYPAKLTIVNANDSSDKKEVDMQVVSGTYRADVTFDNLGLYYVTPSVSLDTFTIKGKSFTVNVGNAVPVIANSDRITKYVLSFGKPFEYDLTGYVTDGDGDELTYSLNGVSFEEGALLGDESVSVEGKTLKITPEKACEGSVYLIASDPLGASCEFNVEVKYGNLLIFILIIVLAVIVLAAAAFFVLNYLKYHKPYKGSIQVVYFDDTKRSSPKTVSPPPGSFALNKIEYDAENVSGIKGRFYGTNSNYVMFESTSKNGFFHNDRKIKKLKIYVGGRETIYSDEEGTSGLEILFFDR